MPKFALTALQIVITISYALVLAFVLLMVGLSGGNVLNLSTALTTKSLGLIAISFGCWAVILTLPGWAIIASVRKLARAR